MLRPRTAHPTHPSTARPTHPHMAHLTHPCTAHLTHPCRLARWLSHLHCLSQSFHPKRHCWEGKGHGTGRQETQSS